ncbi:4-amino-4-deoxy-L-arabinose transferas e-like protein [Microbacterium sp. HM58-2]|nr:4-amino-4-deoxy-L-arabinose transferas e-like protein [Microbacterium sp. HM58-2]
MTRARTILFWAIAAALLVGHAILAWHSLVIWRFWEDEAFNLTVPRNLLAGLGYSSDGALSGSVITPFDPRISTGPVVLLPVAALLATGIDPVMAARLVPLAYWVLLLAGLAVLGRRIAGRWGALLAAAVPLAFTTSAGFSPIQGPADLLGEIPAAALIVWALLVLPRRAWLAGLLVGLAVQAKLIALLALPAFAVALWVLADGRGWARLRDTLRRSWLPLLLAGVPTLLLEIAALLSLGASGYVQHLRSLAGFVLSGGQGNAATSIGQKLTTLADSWSLPAAVAIVGALLALGLAVAGMALAWRSATAEDRLVIAYGLAAIVGALAFVGWWATASRLPLWVRHPAPGVFAFFPIIAAVALWATMRMLPRASAVRVGSAVRIGGAVAASALALIVAAGAALHIASLSSSQIWLLERQREEIVDITAWVAENDVEWLAAEPWGAAVAPIVMTGAHVGLFDAPAMDGVPRLTGLPCTTETLIDSGTFRICAAP